MSELFSRFFAGVRMLVISPHADDESLGCGGTIVRAVEAGASVYLLVVSVGDLVPVDGKNQMTGGGTRRQELAAAARVLGVTDHELLFDDAESHLRLDAMPRRDLAAWLERDARLAVDKVCPHIVILPAISYNQDHEAVLRAGLVACRPHDPAVKPVPSNVWLFEYPPLSWLLPQERFIPQLYVDISAYLPRKLEAYSQHVSQVRDGVHQNSVANVEHLARVRGKEVGVEAAEAFQVMRIQM